MCIKKLLYLQEVHEIGQKAKAILLDDFNSKTIKQLGVVAMEWARPGLNSSSVTHLLCELGQDP